MENMHFISAGSFCVCVCVCVCVLTLYILNPQKKKKDIRTDSFYNRVKF